MAKIRFGTFFKRKVDENGKVSNKPEDKIPFFPKTLANLVFKSDGTTVEETLNTIAKGAGTQEFESMDAYRAALADGSALEDAIYVVNDDNDALIEELKKEHTKG